MILRFAHMLCLSILVLLLMNTWSWAQENSEVLPAQAEETAKAAADAPETDAATTTDSGTENAAATADTQESTTTETTAAAEVEASPQKTESNTETTTNAPVNTPVDTQEAQDVSEAGTKATGKQPLKARNDTQTTSEQAPVAGQNMTEPATETTETAPEAAETTNTEATPVAPAAAEESSPSETTPPPATAEATKTEAAPVAEEDEDEEDEDGEEEEKVPGSQIRFSIVGGGLVPVKGGKAGFAVGGHLGYEFGGDLKNLSIELFLYQGWNDSNELLEKPGENLDKTRKGLKLLAFAPGVRYRVYGERFRVYLSGHIGLSYATYTLPGDSGTSKEGLAADLGGGIEYQLSDMFHIDITAAYAFHALNIPIIEGSANNKGSYLHGLFVGAGIGLKTDL